MTEEAAAKCGLTVGTPVVAGGLDATCGTLGAGVIHRGDPGQGGQAGGMSICTDTYKADPSLILGYHVVPGSGFFREELPEAAVSCAGLRENLQLMRRSHKGRMPNPLWNNWINCPRQYQPEVEGVVFLPYMSGRSLSGIHTPKAFSMDLILLRPGDTW